jgi:hypothetical protein
MPKKNTVGQKCPLSENGQQLLQQWQSLSENEQEELIPHILVLMRSWRAWSTGSISRETWLRDRFEAAGIKLNIH